MHPLVTRERIFIDLDEGITNRNGTKKRYTYAIWSIRGWRTRSKSNNALSHNAGEYISVGIESLWSAGAMKGPG